MSKEKEFVTPLFVQADGINDCYKELVQGILEEGQILVSRGLETKEIRPVTIILSNPRERFLMCPSRLVHPYFQIMESIWILGGRGDVDWISYYLSNMIKYSDGQREFHAPYGKRMRGWGHHRETGLNMAGNGFEVDQFRSCYEYLKKDLNTRHAMMTFWVPFFNQYGIDTIDRPCNVAFHFLIRNGALDLTIFNRSNDIHFGLAGVNVVQFSVILETMAALLEVPVGNQIHMTNSLHYYTESDLTDKVLIAEYEFNPYEHITYSDFQLEEDPPSLMDLDKDLRYFFEEEEKIRESGSSSAVFAFTFLDDALDVAMSFHSYKKGDLEDAFHFIYKVQADDIFVTCSEFLARKITSSEESREVEAMVRERFKNKLSAETINIILHYILTH